MENLSDIAVFVRVVEAKSFTYSARRLGLSRSAASKTVTRLETRLGVRLLNRTTGRLSTTEAGTTLYSRAALRVTVPMSFGLLQVAPAVPELLGRFPEMKLDLLMEDRVVDLVAEGYDVALRVSRSEDTSLVERRLAPCRMVACAALSYFDRHGTPETPEDLRDHDCLGYTYARSPNHWQFTGPDGKRHSVPVRGSYRVNSGLALREAAVAGVGIVQLPTFYVGDDLAEGRMQPLLTDYRTTELSICAVFPQRRHLAPKVRAFVDFMAQRFGPEPYWDRFLNGDDAPQEG